MTLRRGLGTRQGDAKVRRRFRAKPERQALKRQQGVMTQEDANDDNRFIDNSDYKKRKAEVDGWKKEIFFLVSVAPDVPSINDDDSVI